MNERLSGGDFDRYYRGTVVSYDKAPVFIDRLESTPRGFTVFYTPITDIQPRARQWAGTFGTQVAAPDDAFQALMGFISPAYGYIDTPENALYITLLPSQQSKRGFCLSRLSSRLGLRNVSAHHILVKLLCPTRFRWEDSISSPHTLPLSRFIAMNKTFVYYKGSPVGLVTSKGIKLIQTSGLFQRVLKQENLDIPVL